MAITLAFQANDVGSIPIGRFLGNVVLIIGIIMEMAGIEPAS